MLRLGRRPVRLHLIEAETEMARLGAASKLDPEKAFLAGLFALGRERAEAFLTEHKATIGTRSSFDVATRFA
jgi:NTE family protein